MPEAPPLRCPGIETPCLTSSFADGLEERWLLVLFITGLLPFTTRLEVPETLSPPAAALLLADGIYFEPPLGARGPLFGTL